MKTRWFTRKGPRAGSASAALILLVLGGLFSPGPGAEPEGAGAQPKELVLGVRPDAPPFSFASRDAPDDPEKALGYSVGLCRSIGEYVVREGHYPGVRIEWVSVSDRFEALRTGRIDLLCEATTVTLQRTRHFDFSAFTFLSGAAVMTRAGANLRARRPRVGVLGDTTTETVATKIASVFYQENGIGELAPSNAVDFTRFASHAEGLEALAGEAIDLYIADREILLALRDQAEAAGGKSAPRFAVSRRYYTFEPYALAVRNDDEALRYLANCVLVRMFETDEIAQVLAHHFPGKRFSDSIRQLFLIQRLPLGEDEEGWTCRYGKP